MKGLEGGGGAGFEWRLPGTSLPFCGPWQDQTLLEESLYVGSYEVTKTDALTWDVDSLKLHPRNTVGMCLNLDISGLDSAVKRVSESKTEGV